MKIPTMKVFVPYFIIILLASFAVNAQNYRLVQPGVKRYFTNNNHYLRGMRVDSVTTNGTDTIYHLFRTPRGRYVDSNFKSIPINPKSGSWLGKKIIAYPDGIHKIPNHWGDTVTIKTQAQLNESWIIYDDTTYYWYEATVSKIDTMNVLGIVDSVKTITITARYLVGIDTSDPLHAANIRISKNYGIVTSCDLYMFPIHEPGIPFKEGFDYYTDNSGGLIYNLVAFQHLEAQINNPDTMEKYSFNIGDIIQRKNFPHEVMLDRIISKSGTDYISSRITYLREPSSGPFWKFYTNTDDTNLQQQEFYKPGFISYAHMPDTTRMPEEAGQNYIYTYQPLHDDYCIVSPHYTIKRNYIHDSIVSVIPLYTYYVHYKMGIGLVRLYDRPASQPNEYSEDILYIKKGDKEWGAYTPMTIQDSKKIIFALYPNPANEQVIITTGGYHKYRIVMTNMMGQVAKTLESNRQEQVISTIDLPNGIYNLSITYEDENVSHSKIMVQH